MLESQLSELQEKLERMEAEMTIVSEESKDLQDTLEYREIALVEKVTRYATHRQCDFHNNKKSN